MILLIGPIWGIPHREDRAAENGSPSEQREIVLPAGDHRTAIRLRATDYASLAEAGRVTSSIDESAGIPRGTRALAGGADQLLAGGETMASKQCSSGPKPARRS